jgi:flagellar basal body rod protein FlgC
MSSVFSIAVGGMNAAMARLHTSARNIAGSSGTGTGDLAQDMVQLMMSRIEFEANARVAATAARTYKSLLDIRV